MKKILLVMTAALCSILGVNTYALTTAHLNNTTNYCGEIRISYGPKNAKFPNLDDFQLLAKNASETSQFNKDPWQQQYLLQVQLQPRATCSGSHFSKPVNCTLNVSALPANITVNVVPNSQTQLTCNVTS